MQARARETLRKWKRDSPDIRLIDYLAARAAPGRSRRSAASCSSNTRSPHALQWCSDRGECAGLASASYGQAAKSRPIVSSSATRPERYSINPAARGGGIILYRRSDGPTASAVFSWSPPSTWIERVRQQPKVPSRGPRQRSRRFDIALTVHGARINPRDRRPRRQRVTQPGGECQHQPRNQAKALRRS